MERPHITITTIKEVKYDANHINISKDREGVYKLRFLCSGGNQEFSPEEIKSIEFHATGAQWCSECDQSIETQTTS